MSSWLFALVGACPPSPLLWLAARSLQPRCGPPWPRARPSGQGPAAQNSGSESQRQYETPHTCPGALLQLTSRSTIPQPQRQQQELQGTSTPKFPSDWVAGWRQAAASHLACFFFWSNGHGLIACGPASCCHPLPLVSAQRCERLTAFWLHPTLRRPEEECHHLPSSTHKPAI
jgi:hypothetical protein